MEGKGSPQASIDRTSHGALLPLMDMSSSCCRSLLQCLWHGHPLPFHPSALPITHCRSSSGNAAGASAWSAGTSCRWGGGQLHWWAWAEWACNKCFQCASAAHAARPVALPSTPLWSQPPTPSASTSFRQSLLARSLPPGVLHQEVQFERFEEAADASHVTLHFKGGRPPLTARLLIGADGSQSGVRQQLFGDGPPIYTGKAGLV